MRNGFILGKFMPPHAGHIGICQAAALLCDKLTVLVCSRDCEPIPGSLRTAWMQQLLPQANIIPMHRDIPQEPSEHPDFWNIWRKAVKEHHPEPIDMVFGSEAYVVRLAEELKAEPVVMDPERLGFAVSGTAVREDCRRVWAHIPGVVRPYFQKRVVLFGPESVGKSTLAQALAAAFQTQFVPEYGRVYDQYKQNPEWSASDFVKIAQRHTALRKAIAYTAGPVLFEDTDPLLTMAWEIMLTETSSPELEAEIELADLYLLLDIDVPWVNDGTRYFDKEARQNFMQLCIELLERLELPYQIIQGSWAERQHKATLYTQELLNKTFKTPN